MIVCPKCGKGLDAVGDAYHCGKCEREYPIIDGVALFGIDTKQDSYPEEAFDRLAKVEGGNFWFNVRNNIIGGMLKRYCPDMSAKILEVGCGTGYTSAYVKHLGYNIECADMSPAGLRHCQRRCGKGGYYQLDIGKSPFRSHFDVILALDVLEHVEDDTTALRNIHASLKDGGIVIITVPAHMFLWSKADENARHKRRYSMGGLKGNVEAAGFKAEKATYFMTLLMPAVLVSRLIMGNSVRDELKINPVLNRIFFHIFNLESRVISHLNLPFGVSLLVVARKTGKPSADTS